jgi:hypothetical protein
LAEKTVEARAKEKETWGGRLLDKKTGDNEGSAEISTPSKSTKPAPATDASEPASAGGQSLRSGSLWWTDPFVVLLAAIVTATVLVFFRPE